MGRLLTAKDVAAKTTVAVETLYSWASQQREDVPTGFKLGRRRVWDEDDVDAWIERQRAGGAR